MIITEILARNAHVYPNSTALIERSPDSSCRREITWRAFDDRANSIAGALAARGVSKGDRVALLLENCLEWLPIYFGILRAGALVVPMDFTSDVTTLSHYLAISTPSAIFFGRKCRPTMEELQARGEHGIRNFIEVKDEETDSDEIPDFAESIQNILAHQPETAPDVSLNLLDEAALYFTSGSTGQPKAALLTHRNLEFACFLENINHKETKDDIFLCIPPLFHAGSMMHWFGGFLVGSAGVILKTITVRHIFEAISEEQVTVVWLLVPLAKDILCRIENGLLKLKHYKLDQWRLMHMGAQPVSPNLITEWRSIFPNHQYNETYGLTETTGPGCIQLGINNFHKAGAIGTPGFDWEVRIVDEKLKERPRGMAGRLMVKGPGVLKEYYGNPAATQKYLRDGWFITGDIAMQDEDGFIWYVDREDDVISFKDYAVYPVELENFLLLHKHIQDAAVFGLRYAGRQRVAALIQTKVGCTLTEEALADFCQALPPYKRPSLFFFGKVPRGLTGKIMKYNLKSTYKE